jgi:hypothetical protein
VVKTEIKETIKEAPRDHSEAKAQVSGVSGVSVARRFYLFSQALLRDGYRCVVTGAYDATYTDLGPEDPMVFTELAHILPESNYFDTPDASKSSGAKMFSQISGGASMLTPLRRNTRPQFWPFLKSFGYHVVKISGFKVHSLYNVMTMEKNTHDWFDRLYLWFEPMVGVTIINYSCPNATPRPRKVENRYRVKTTRAGFQRSVPDEVTFTSSDPSIFPYPSPQLLGLHAACAKVAHLSGAGEYIDKFDSDADDLDVLATDGSSSDVLTHALLRSTPRSISIGA